MVSIPRLLSAIKSDLMESASLLIGASLHGRLSTPPSRYFTKISAMSLIDFGSPHSLRFCSLVPFRPIPYASSSPKAGDLESPHLPLGNSSQSCVRVTYDLFLFFQKMGRTSSSLRPSPRDCLHGSACFNGRCSDGVRFSSSRSMRVACARFMV